MFKLKNKFRQFRQNEDGYSTVEFLIVATTFLTGFFWVFETGLIMTKQMMLERAVDIVVRDLRLASSPAYTHDYIKEKICDEALVLKECSDNLLLELVEVDLDVGFDRTATCIDRANEVTPVTSWEPGQRSEVVYMRACVLVDPMMPQEVALFSGTTDTGIPLIADTAFVNEPE